MDQPNSTKDWFQSFPSITRNYVVLLTANALLFSFNLIDVPNLTLDWTMIFKRFQVFNRSMLLDWIDY